MIGKKDIMFWFVLFYVVAVLTLFVVVNSTTAASLTTAVAVLTPLVIAQAGLIGWNLNTDKKNPIAPVPFDPNSTPKA